MAHLKLIQGETHTFRGTFGPREESADRTLANNCNCSSTLKLERADKPTGRLADWPSGRLRPFRTAHFQRRPAFQPTGMVLTSSAASRGSLRETNERARDGAELNDHQRRRLALPTGQAANYNELSSLHHHRNHHHGRHSFGEPSRAEATFLRIVSILAAVRKILC